MKRQLFSRPDWYFARTGDLTHRAVNVIIPGAPAFMKGLRAVFVSDTHVMPGTTDGQLDSLFESINALSPDILFLGGDYAEMPGDAVRFYRGLRKVNAPLGKFAVVGNNDHWEEQPIEVTCGAMAECGVRPLMNDACTVPVNGGRLIIAGVDEHLGGKPDARGLYPENREEGMYSILLSHYPCPPEVMPDLMLSGHTHGGQFNFMGITPFTVGFEGIMNREITSRAIAGLHEMNGGKLFVGKGIGASRLQLRIGVRPEIYTLQFEC